MRSARRREPTSLDGAVRHPDAHHAAAGETRRACGGRRARTTGLPGGAAGCARARHTGSADTSGTTKAHVAGAVVARAAARLPGATASAALIVGRRQDTAETRHAGGDAAVDGRA